MKYEFRSLKRNSSVPPSLFLFSFSLFIFFVFFWWPQWLFLFLSFVLFGFFEEGNKEVYDDRAYRAKGLDVPAKVDANSRSEKKSMHGTGVARKIWEGGSFNFRILTLVRRTHELIIGNSQSNKEVHKETSTQRRSVWGVWLSLRILGSWYV